MIVIIVKLFEKPGINLLVDNREMKIFFKILLVICGIGFVFFVGMIVMIKAAFGGFDKDYSVTELKENFAGKRAEIYDVKNYINKIIPPNKSVEIEFSKTIL